MDPQSRRQQAALSIERLIATRDRIKAVLPDADVADYRGLIPDLQLPDPDDRHVLAAAIAGKASLIVTWNLKDFPLRDIAFHGVASQSPDDFLNGLHATFPDALISSVKRARNNLRKTMPAVDAFIDELQQCGLKTFLSLLRQDLDGLI